MNDIERSVKLSLCYRQQGTAEEIYSISRRSTVSGSAVIGR